MCKEPPLLTPLWLTDTSRGRPVLVVVVGPDFQHAMRSTPEASARVPAGSRRALVMAVWVPLSLGGASGPANGCQREAATRRRQGGACTVCAPVVPPRGGRAGEPAYPHPDRRRDLLPCPYLRPTIPTSPVRRRYCAAPCGRMDGEGEPGVAALAPAGLWQERACRPPESEV